LTDRDIFNKSYIDGNIAAAELGLDKERDEWSWDGLKNVMKLWYEFSKVELPGVPVKEIMIPNPITVFKKTAISEAARIMRKNDFGQLPVRDAKDNLLAMIYDHDVISILAENEE
jgi:CBS domain-containing protein